MSKPDDVDVASGVEVHLENVTLDGLRAYLQFARNLPAEKLDTTIQSLDHSQFLANAAQILTDPTITGTTRQTAHAVLDLMYLGRERGSAEIRTAMVGQSLRTIYDRTLAILPRLAARMASYRDIFPGMIDIAGPGESRRVDPVVAQAAVAHEMAR